MDYFEKGNWIIGNRQFIINWEMVNNLYSIISILLNIENLCCEFMCHREHKRIAKTTVPN